MATRLKEVDAVMVGMGWTGSILARELTKAGLKVVGLERGQDRTPGEDFTLAERARRAALRAAAGADAGQLDRHHHASATRRPRWRCRSAGSARSCRATASAARACIGAALHWRYLPSDFHIRSHIQQRYGANAIPDDMTIADWPRQLRRARAVLRPVRQALRRLRQGRQPARPEGRRRQSVRRAAHERISEQADQVVALPAHDVRRGREEASAITRSRRRPRS